VPVATRLLGSHQTPKALTWWLLGFCGYFDSVAADLFAHWRGCQLGHQKATCVATSLLWLLTAKAASAAGVVIGVHGSYRPV